MASHASWVGRRLGRRWAPCHPPSRLSRCSRRVASLALSLFFAGCLAVTGTSVHAFDGQAPIAEASAEDLVMLLGGALPYRAFARTALPDVCTHLCRDVLRRPAATGGRASGTRTLEVIAAPASPDAAAPLATWPSAPGPVAPNPTASDADAVPYAGEATPGVHLDVRFAFGSDRIAPGDVTLLDNLAAALRDVRLLPERFAIAGHTDAVGPAAVNLELSCARALAVVRHLQTQGVDAARLTAYGFGSARLLPGAPPTAAVHRRVEIRRAP